MSNELEKETGALYESLFARYAELEPCREEVRAAFDALRACFAGGGKLLLCGNGGSCADCDHIVGELAKGFLRRRPLPETARDALRDAGPGGEELAGELQGALQAMNLCAHSALVTAVSNDIRPAFAYAQQVYAWGAPGDVLLAISTSGQAENVYYALLAARAAKMTRIGLTGRNGGRMAQACDVVIRAPATATYEVQEFHLPIYHTLCAMLEAEFFT